MTTDNSERDMSGRSGEEASGDNGEGSIFSQNLQLDFNAPGTGERRAQPESAGGGMSAEERGTYFRLEGCKTVEILSGELDRFGGEDFAPVMVRELWRSWQTLWGSSGEPAIARFTSAFRTVVEGFEEALVAGRGDLTGPERLAVSRLLQSMEQVARSGDDYEQLEFCREANNRVRRMVAAWSSAGGKGRPPEESESDAGPGGGEDISGSIDEWFSQVSRFITSEQAGESGEVRSDAVEDADSFEVGALPEEEPEEIPLVDDADLEDGPGAESPEEVTAEPAAEDAPPPAGEPSVPAAPVGEAPGGGDEESAAEDSLRDEEPVGPGSEGWLAEVYFAECCRDVMETVRNNVDRLEGGSPARTAAMLAGRVDFLIELADDFALAEVRGELAALRERLESISAGGKAGRGPELDDLLGAVSRLERECDRALCAAF